VRLGSGLKLKLPDRPADAQVNDAWFVTKHASPPMKRGGGSLGPLFLVSALAIAIVVGVIKPAAVGPFSPTHSANTQAAEISLVSSVEPHGVLTAAEYQTLVRAQAALKRALSGKKLNWHAAYAACPASSTTPLLATSMALCTADISELQAIVSTESAVKDESTCAAQPGATPLSCLLPAYQNLANTANKAASLDEATYHAAAARGFTGTCLYTVADTPTGLKQQRKLARVASETATAMRTQNESQLALLGPKLGTALTALVHESGPSNLAVCPHQ
jgi:hypothetical protein